MTENATPPRRQFRVVILGAGMAGLSAANHLIKNGFTDFKILEARDRIGGRIVSVDMNSQKVGEHSLLIVHRRVGCSDEVVVYYLLRKINIYRKMIQLC